MALKNKQLVWCAATTQWIFGDETRARRREIVTELLRYRETLNAAHARIATLRAEYAVDDEFFRFAWGWIFA